MQSELGFQLGKFLLISGIVIAVIGLAVMGGFKFPGLGLGRLPGDLVHKGKHGSLYFPIVSCLVISVAATLVLWLFSVLVRR